jgi:hypothetical protein
MVYVNLYIHIKNAWINMFPIMPSVCPSAQISERSITRMFTNIGNFVYYNCIAGFQNVFVSGV